MGDFCILDIKIVPTIIPENQKAKNMDPLEVEEGGYFAASLGLVVVGVIVAIVVLDLPSLFL